MPPLPEGRAVLAPLLKDLMGFTSYLYSAQAKRAVGGLWFTSSGSRVHTLTGQCVPRSSTTLRGHPAGGSSWSTFFPPFHTPSNRGVQGTVLCSHSTLGDVSAHHPFLLHLPWVTQQHRRGITTAKSAPGARGATDHSQEELWHPCTLSPLPAKGSTVFSWGALPHTHPSTPKYFAPVRLTWSNKN